MLQNRVIYAVEDSDGGGVEYAHLFLLPEGLDAKAADLILERLMSRIMEDEEWTWDEAIRCLTTFKGWIHLDFEVGTYAY
jgi:hypothetical protein